MVLKKGVNYSNNKERCSAGNLDDLLWKYCKSRYTDLSCSDVHWNFWRMCNALRLGSEVCNWYWLAISPIWRRRSPKCLKKSSVFILHFAPGLCFTLSLQSAFYTQSEVYPWSAVCSRQSVLYTDCCCFFFWDDLKNPCFLAWGFVFVFKLLCSFTKNKTGSVFPAFCHTTFRHALFTCCNVAQAGYIA